MFIGNTFGKTLDILHREMDVNLIRRQIIANNIANADTPNFKRSELNFESSLKKALESEKVRKLPAFITDPRHIPFNRPVDYRTVRPRKILDFWTTSKNNGNNVDLEQETMDLLNNELLYNMMVQTVSHQFSQVQLVLR
ncbi:flagellar basal-body rod protein FlgB [Spirochaeta thermophila DSM 6578]|uniref:Flagellar basal body rod protein FlgB n=1 Tax=Winmispira thermophila (strain ATCC 700085 / DSM 6578 / Z-1203) TaxID=869211 RepID=G0GCC1_WINT7|nr:flagellar basal body rod protein FlgB [Spirochaeta thermophila]AEJ61206.1 flagellar basal-body rod protein FlgB [Spirochaeta thermophila DSM 6578]